MRPHAQHLTLNAATGLGQGLVPLGLFAVFLAVYALYPNNYPHHDELYHVLAGASYAADGTLRLGDGVYLRTPLFTMLIGELFDLFGVSLPVARAPSILASALWVAVVYLCARPATGRLAAAIAAIGFGLSPLVVDVAKMARFYAVHGLFFTLGAFAVYWTVVTTAGARQRLAGWLMAAAFLGAALYLQVTTAIGATGIAVWAAGHLAVTRLGLGRRFWVTASFALALATVLALVAFRLGLLAETLEDFRRVAPWAVDRQNYRGFYLDLLLGYYPVWLPLFPLAVLAAFSRVPRLAVFCTLVFGLAVVLHSLAGMKAERYVTYLMPFFWIVLGIALAPLIAPTRTAIGSLAMRIGTMPALAPLPGELASGAVRLAAAASLSWFAATSLALPQSFQKLVHRIDPPLPDWQALPGAVGLDEDTLFLTPNELHALYFIGDLHATLGPPPNGDTVSQTGRPALTDASALARLIACRRAGVIAADAWRWQNPGVVAAPVRRYAERHLEPHPAGPSLNLVIYTWNREEPPARPCPPPFDRSLRLHARPS